MARATTTHQRVDRIAICRVEQRGASGLQQWRIDPNKFGYFRRAKPGCIRVQVLQGCSRANSYSFDSPVHMANLLLRCAISVIAC